MPDERIDYVGVEDLLEIADGIMGEVAVRDAGLLAATTGRPQVTVFGEDAYPSFEDKAAARIFCILNGRDLASTVDEAEALMLAAAEGSLDVPDIAAWVRRHLEGAS